MPRIQPVVVGRRPTTRCGVLAREAEEIARAEGKTLSAVIQEALRLARRQRLRRELRGIRGYWSRMAKEKGILSEKDLERYLAE